MSMTAIPQPKMLSLRPSDAIAELANLLHMLEVGGRANVDELLAWIDFADLELLDSFHEADFEEWRLSAEEVVHIALRDFHTWPPAIPQNADQFVIVVGALQALDRWHAPIVPAGKLAPQNKNNDHHEVEDRFAVEQCFGSSNEGIIIPSTSWEYPDLDPFDDIAMNNLTPFGGNSIMLLRRLLEYTAFVPNVLSLSCADGECDASRIVNIKYIQIKDYGISVSRADSNDWKIGIAPLMEAEDDATILYNELNNTYLVHPKFDKMRIASVVKIALEERIEVLFFPECSIDQNNIEWIKLNLKSLSVDYFNETGEVPKLKYVFAGVSGLPKIDGESGRNYIVVLNTVGNEIARQDKLFRWNFSPDIIKRYNFHLIEGMSEGGVKENIEGGKEAYIIDLLGFGRFINLICADVDQNSPGDWFLTYIHADWVNAPIFDKSICWTFDARGPEGPWITKRSLRAARYSTAQIVVSNSMMLTYRLNTANDENGIPQKFDKCGIGFLAKTVAGTAKYQQIFAGMSHAPPVCASVKSTDTWT